MPPGDAITNLPEPRDVFSRTLSHCISSNPRSARWIVALMALYLHLGPFSRYVIDRIDRKIEQLDAAPAAPVETGQRLAAASLV